MSTSELTWEEVDLAAANRELAPQTYVLGSLTCSPYIECLVCRQRSFKAHAIENLYCPDCNRIHIPQLDD